MRLPIQVSPVVRGRLTDCTRIYNAVLPSTKISVGCLRNENLLRVRRDVSTDGVLLPNFNSESMGYYPCSAQSTGSEWKAPTLISIPMIED